MNMADVGKNAAEYFAKQTDFDEVYEVVKTAEVVYKRQRHRIDVLKGFSNPKIPYSTRSYKEEVVGDKKVWVLNRQAPWTCRDDADSALWQALGFFSLR
jgi:hypothetical protein